MSCLPILRTKIWVFCKLSRNGSILIVFTVCSSRKWCLMLHGTWNPLVHFGTRPCSPVPTSNSFENLCVLEYCLQIIAFKFHFLFFFLVVERGMEECEAWWCSSVCWMCLADEKSCCVFWFWAICGTLVLTQYHCHYRNKLMTLCLEQSSRLLKFLFLLKQKIIW